ncbi:hypothetical protein [Paraburkholderia lacunae]|uniref:Tetratricopeptide repeat protein n=1 Tax=Paraburkholderia lacunae TaxID=2211104 RepID=A0A370N554_9BURK|nr:hypothetical protein [Paraburkholderia lacunae]RDK00740.1 hypothetical protein DLM46_20505 [Paraburkholderia lacunae]
MSALELSVEAVNVAMPSVAVEFLIAYMDALRHLGRHADALGVFDRTISVARRYRNRADNPVCLRHVRTAFQRKPE